MKASLAPIFALAALGTLAACVPEQAPQDKPLSLCRPEQTGKLIGMMNPSDAQIMEITGATAVRRAMDGQPMTMEMMPMRATVILDGKTGKVLQANCS